MYEALSGVRKTYSININSDSNGDKVEKLLPPNDDERKSSIDSGRSKLPKLKSVSAA